MVADKVGCIILANKPAEELLALGSDHGCRAAQDIISAAIMGETVCDREIFIGGHGGNRGRWVCASVAPISNLNGDTQGAVLVCQDITERKRTEECVALLAEAGQKLNASLDFRQTLQQVADLATGRLAEQCLCDLLQDGQLHRIAWGSRSVERLTILSQAADWIPDHQAAHPILQALTTQRPSLARNISEEWIQSVAVNEQHADALRRFEVDSMLSVPITAYGRLFGVFTLTRSKAFGPCFDSIDVALAEELGRRVGIAVENGLSHARLLESERRFRALADTIPQMVWSCTGEGFCDYFNLRWQEYTGLSNGEQLRFGWLAAIHPDDRERVRNSWRESAECEEDYQIEYRIRRADGVYRWFRALAACQLEGDGAAHRWYGISTDIEDERTTAERRRQQSEELQRSNSELQDFAFVVAHDLREPLRTVRSFSQLLTRNLPECSGPEVGEFASYIESGVERMEALITGLLNYAQLGSRQEPEQVVDCAAALQSALAQLGAMVESADASITSQALPQVRGNEMMVAQVFQNLISNALKYRSNARPEVQISAREQGDFWQIAVADNGLGIAPQYLQQVFGVFRRLHGRDVPGIGLGLAYCKKVVERHGGHIWVESEEGKGSTFYFTLPKAS